MAGPETSTDVVQQLTKAEMGRRALLTRSAVLAGAWTAPSVLAIPAARAQVGTPPPGTCTTSAYDVLVTYSGAATGTTGPAEVCSNSGGGSFSTLEVDIPVNPPVALATFSGLTALCGQAPCQAHAQIASMAVHLPKLHPSLPWTVQATALESSASCSGGTLTRSFSIATLDVNGGSVLVAAAPANTTVFDESNGLGSLKIIINEQSGNTVNALHIVAKTTAPAQTVDIVVASASASC